jgi:hypothetical protein
MLGCPDNAIKPGESGGTPSGGTTVGGQMGGNSGGVMGGSTIGNTCAADADCGNDQYCEIEGDAFIGECQAGCRSDSCDSGQECNLDTRECGFPPCEGDNTCPSGTYCNEDQECSTGCRVDQACPDEFDEDGRLLLCDPSSRECVPHSPCCIAGGDDTDQCQAYTATQCDEAGGQLIQNALLCDDNPCGQGCEVDANCRPLDVGASTFYCDPIDLRCNEGCREGECDGDLVCDLDRRRCIQQSCVVQEDCANGQYCDLTSFTCVSGCSQNEDCNVGESCLGNTCVSRCDPDMPGDCGEGNYCDADTLICRQSCATHDDCEDQEACDPLTSQCILGLCRDDEPLGELSGEPNDTFEEATQLVFVPTANMNGIEIATTTGRVLCDENLDLYQFNVGQGYTIEVNLNHSAEGNLSFRLYGDQDLTNPLIIANQGQDREFLLYPENEGFPEQQDLYIEVYGNGENGDRIEYELEVTNIPPGQCPGDSRETGEGDNTFEVSTSLVAGGVTEYQRSRICPQDQDWYSLVMTTNDGLTVQVTTSIESDTDNQLRLDLYPQSALAGLLGSQTPTYSLDLDQQGTDEAGRVRSIIEDPELGQRIYTFDLPFNSLSFSEEPWYLSVRGNTTETLTLYNIEVRHEPANDVCVNEGREPNNEVNTATDLVETFDFPVDDNGYLAQGRDNRVDDGVICGGDQDYYCFDLADGDIIEAWAVSDTVMGLLEIRIVDNQGGGVGTTANHTTRMDAVEYATLAGAVSGEYCVVVDGLGNAQGSYELNVRRRVVQGGICTEDEIDGRNDESSTATELEDISNEEGLRFEQLNGLMCPDNDDPSDWYQFPVTVENSRICVMLEGFEHANADLDLRLYEPPVMTQDTCTVDANCEGDSSCIGGYCQIEAVESTYLYDFEMLTQSKVVSDIGTYYLKVDRGAMGETVPYDVRVTVTPERDTCVEDWQELGNLNDQERSDLDDPSRATPLGSGHVGLCDTWLCNREGEIDEDWYQITVPAQEDRTVLIQFAHNTDGALQLYYLGETLETPNSLGVVISEVASTNFQCLNIKGGSTDITAEIGVGTLPGGFLPDGDQRIDYSLRVLPTNLDMFPEGECRIFNSSIVPSCEPGVIHPELNPIASDCWATISMPE